MYSMVWPCGLECQGHHFCQVLPFWLDTKAGQIHEYVYRTHFTVQSIASGQIVDLMNENVPEHDMGLPSKHRAFTHCCVNVGRPSLTLVQHWNSTESMPVMLGWSVRSRCRAKRQYLLTFQVGWCFIFILRDIAHMESAQVTSISLLPNKTNCGSVS